MLHDLCDLNVKLVDQVTGWVVDDFAETFQANASLADITIEQADADDDVGQLAQLRYFLGSGEGNERPQTSSR